MIRLAFWGRCSTENCQDPVASRAWQLRRATALVEPRGGVIVAEYFDVDRSRSIPPQRRPQARLLLDQLANPDRGFDAVVVGEPQRAFYGNQFGNTLPVFEHFGVPLWVPEVGGPIDPANEAHDFIMSAFGSISKGERSRIKIRVRTTMAALAQGEGRFLGGRPPYGYQLADAGPHPNPAKASDGKRLHRLELDPVATGVVRRIFTERLAGSALGAIADGLTADGIACPSAHDPGRNRHRDGLYWHKAAVRSILANPRYTGRQVWNRQRKDEVLIDLQDVTLGHTTKMRWNPPEAWVWSDEVVHPPIVSIEEFTRTQQRMADQAELPPRKRRPRPTNRPYLLRGLMWCGACGRRMHGTWISDAPYYRCRSRGTGDQSGDAPHSRSVSVRESVATVGLDDWITRLFDPRHVDKTLTALDASQASEHSHRRSDLVDVLAGIASVPEGAGSCVEDAHPLDKAALYATLGVRITYFPDQATVSIAQAHRGGG